MYDSDECMDHYYRKKYGDPDAPQYDDPYRDVPPDDYEDWRFR